MIPITIWLSLSHTHARTHTCAHLKFIFQTSSFLKKYSKTSWFGTNLLKLKLNWLQSLVNKLWSKILPLINYETCPIDKISYHRVYGGNCIHINGSFSRNRVIPLCKGRLCVLRRRGKTVDIGTILMTFPFAIEFFFVDAWAWKLEGSLMNWFHLA